MTEFKSNPELDKFLKSKIKAEEEIEKIITKQTGEKVRFKRKKFVAELGEYYFYLNTQHLFKKELKQSEKPNASCDFKGILKDKYAKQYGFKLNKELKIEVKTRYDQKGGNHLRGIKKEKFDILGFVSLDKEYQCYYVGLVRSNDVKPKQNRIVFTKLYHEKVFWENHEYKVLR